MKRHHLVTLLVLVFAATNLFAADDNMSGQEAKPPIEKPANHHNKHHSKQIISSNKPILVSKNQPIFTIEINDNRTTGYAWLLSKYNQNLVEVVSETYTAADTKLVGAPGKSTWTFKLKPLAFNAPHITKISLVHLRPWEVTDLKDVEKANYFVISD